MFERFTDRARRVVAFAQEEARQRQHNYIGTEHLLLGLLREPDGLAARTLGALGVDPDAVRQRVRQAVRDGKGAPEGHIPFTPRAKKALELSLREALRLHHKYIGTEHLLLGLLREAEGVAATTLTELGADQNRVRDEVSRQLVGYQQRQRDATSTLGGLWRRSGAAPAETPPLAEPTRATWRAVLEAGRLAGGGPVGTHHLVLAAVSDPGGAAARTLAAQGVDLDRLRAALREADVSGTSDELPEDAGRRTMTLRVGADGLTVRVTDPELVEDARQAAAALGARTGRAELIPGDLPATASLADVWRSLRQSLQHIRTAAAQPSAGPPAEPPAD